MTTTTMKTLLTSMNNNRDWVGSNASVFKTLGATNHTDGERAENDFYATDPVAIDKLLSKFTPPQVRLRACLWRWCFIEAT